MNGMQGHQTGDAAWHREQFSPAKHGEHVAEVFNKQRVEQLEATIHNLAAENNRLRGTEKFLRSERPMARRLTELEDALWWAAEHIEPAATKEFETGDDCACPICKVLDIKKEKP